jgi:hypothetical protein
MPIPARRMLFQHLLILPLLERSSSWYDELLEVVRRNPVPVSMRKANILAMIL